MSYQAFCSLHEKLESGIIESIKEAAEGRKKKKRSLRRRRRKCNNPKPPPPPNGDITTSVRLACALRYFSGGSPYDIMSNFGVSHSEMMDSVWYVVDATNRTESFHIKYPEDHAEQRKIADGFMRVSQVNFSCVGGTIDGILVWIPKPSIKEAKRVRVDQQKFFCARKNKFGLNCQAVCDVRGRFLDISIVHGGSSSDVLAFEKSELKQRLDNGLLADGILLFGDNAYLNCVYMATPYPNTTGGPKDNYNYFHSQCRIRIECAFGMLVQRWGILRMAMPKGISIKKTIAMVLALAKLHNFCIDSVDGAAGVPNNLAAVEQNIATNEFGSVPLVHDAAAGVATPQDLLNAGNHFDDVPRDTRRQRGPAVFDPRPSLMAHVVSTNLTRPRRSIQ